jgi:homogentisate 1,2-dioxygenase
MSVPPQWIRGETSRQAHVALPPGTVEDEHGRGGFYGPASHLYRRHPPTDWVAVDGPAVHRAFDLRLGSVGDDLWPTLVLGNQDLSIGWHRMGAPFRPEFKRDADGDELFFVHAGEGVLRTEYGPLEYRPGHYLLVPRGTTYRFEPSSPTDVLAIEAAGERFSLPDRGPLGRHAVFDPAILDVPEPEAVDEEGEFVVVVKRGGHDTRVTYRFHPCDVVGWKGDLAPLRLHVEDLRPVVSPRYHLPPSVHTTFLAPSFVVCTFAPRPMETDPEAIRLPFFHRNVEYDEVLFYHRGEFMSRAGIDEGMLTFHPVGLHHGPQPGARERDAAAPKEVPRFADEVAVMIDSRHPLEAAVVAQPWELDGYVDSWVVP